MAEVKVVLRAIDEMSGPTKRAGGALSTLKSGLTSAGIALGAVAAAGYAAQKVLDATVGTWQRNALAVGDFAEKLGTSTEEASALREMAGDLGVDLGALEMGFKSMARNGLDPSISGLIEARRQILGTKTDSERLALAQKLLGKAGADLIPIFNQLSEEELANYVDGMQKGQVVTKAQVEQARQLRDNIDQLNDAYESTRLVIGGMLAGELTEFVEKQELEWQAYHRLRELGIKPTTVAIEELVGVMRGRNAEAAKWLAIQEDATGGAGELEDATASLTASQYLEAAAEAEIAGNEELKLHYLRLYNAAKLHNDALARTMALLTALTSHDWNIEANMNLGRNQFLGGGGVVGGAFTGGQSATDQAWRDYWNGKGPRPPGGQHGLDMIVPPGFPGDSFPILASSGERVQVTPEGKSSGTTVNLTINTTGGIDIPALEDALRRILS